MQSFISQQARSVEPATYFNQAFRLFVACEDQLSAAQAKKVQDQIVALCGAAATTTAMSWSFALLCNDQLREHALLQAATADMIILSFRAQGEVPGAVRRWLERLPVRPQTGQTALVVLVGPEEQDWAGPHPQIPYLRQLAESRGLDFMSNQDGWEYMDFTKITARHATGPLATFAEEPAPFDSWTTGGINE